MQTLFSIRNIGIILIVLGTLVCAYKIQRFIKEQFNFDEKITTYPYKRTDQIIIILAILYIIVGMAYLLLST